MTMSELITVIISTIGGSAILIGAVAWVVKSVINHALSRDIEKFKLILQNESQQELMRLQSSLQLHEFEHQIRFSQLHERLGIATIEVYDRLKRLYAEVKEALSILSMDSRSSEQIRTDLQKASDAFIEYYPRHKILFPKAIANRIDEFHFLLRKAVVKYRQSERAGQAHPDDSRWEELQAEVDNIIDEKLPALFEVLEQYFREILGSISYDSIANGEQIASADPAKAAGPQS